MLIYVMLINFSLSLSLSPSLSSAYYISSYRISVVQILQMAMDLGPAAGESDARKGNVEDNRARSSLCRWVAPIYRQEFFNIMKLAGPLVSPAQCCEDACYTTSVRLHLLVLLLWNNEMLLLLLGKTIGTTILYKMWIFRPHMFQGLFSPSFSNPCSFLGNVEMFGSGRQVI